MKITQIIKDNPPVILVFKITTNMVNFQTNILKGGI